MTEASKPRRTSARAIIRQDHPHDEPKKLNPHWRSHFLAILAETSNVTASAFKAGISTSHAYKVRRCEADFRAAWQAALLEGYEHLELETLERLRFGTGKDDPKFDIANALRLLAIHKESAAREMARLSQDDEEIILASLNAKIDTMRAQEADAALTRSAQARETDGSV